MAIEDWLLTRSERANSATAIDDDAAGPDAAWSDGNMVRSLIHGATYFRELHAAIERTGPGDTIMFVDWRGDPDEQLTADPNDTVAAVLCRAAARGVGVYGLVWRSHLDRFQLSAQENRHLDEEIEAAGGCCLLDMRVRTGGSHHQKFVVLRHADRPEWDVAYLGGIDLCHGRRDDIAHAGDAQSQPMAAVYGPKPPWHDVQIAICGPAVADVETVFRERWDDPQPLSRNPVHRIADRLRSDDTNRRPLPPRGPRPAAVGKHTVQLLRTYPRRLGGYPFAPHGEHSIARGYIKALRQARHLIYVEDQYMWSRDVAEQIADALRANPELLLIAVLPHYPDEDGRMSMPPNLVGRAAALNVITSAAPGRVGVYGIENAASVPIYVHAKVCVVDDVWATTGSDNFNRRSWTHDSELTAVVWDRAPASPLDDPSEANGDSGPIGRGNDDVPRAYARELRIALAREHLGITDADPKNDPDLTDARRAFTAFAESAAELEAWHEGGRRTPRPPGQLRPLAQTVIRTHTRAWAAPMYRVLYDPDGRRLLDRWRNRF